MLCRGELPACGREDTLCRRGSCLQRKNVVIHEGNGTYMTWNEELRDIAGADADSIRKCWERWDSLCKPLRGLGRLEEMVAELAGIQRTDRPQIRKRAVVIMGADNGVVAEGVSQTGSEVTAQVLENMGEQISSVCVMSRMLHADVFPVNIGMNRDAYHPRVRNMAVRRGTGNIAREAAMSREECLLAIERGIGLVRELKESGYDLLLVGEMGIGNTTTSAACASVLFGRDPEQVTGRGAGLSGEGLVRKVGAIRRAIAVNRPDPKDPIDTLSKVGGLDIAGMTGCYLGAALERMPVLIDGLVSGIAACFAVMLAPAAADYMIATHSPKEPAGDLIMAYLRKKPVLYADMHLGEATGAAAVLPLLDLALQVYDGLPSFAGGGVKAYEHLN